MAYAYFLQVRLDRSKQDSQEPLPWSVTDGDWQKFTSEKYGFTVLMPTTPKEKILTNESPQGAVETHAFISETGSVAFGVTYSGYPTNFNFEHYDTKNLELLFDTSRNSMLGQNEKLIREHSISHLKYPGREIEMTKLNGQVRMTVRVYVIGSEAVSVAALIPKSYNDPQSVTRFLDSFRLTAGSTN